MTRIPVTKKDFIEVGKRFNSAQLVNECDRLIRLAEEDIQLLKKRGYSPAMLEKLRELRARLQKASAERKHLLGLRRGAVDRERESLRQGFVTLRTGAAVLKSSLNRYAQDAKIEEDDLREQVNSLTQEAASIKGNTGSNSAKLRARLETLRAILLKSPFSSDPEDLQGREEFMRELEENISNLTRHSEEKKSLADGCKEKTSELNEIEGRLYNNLSQLSAVGKAVWTEQFHPERARLYRMSALFGKKKTQTANA